MTRPKTNNFSTVVVVALFLLAAIETVHGFHLSSISGRQQQQQRRPSTSSSSYTASVTNSLLYGSSSYPHLPDQNPGESDLDYIKRVIDPNIKLIDPVEHHHHIQEQQHQYQTNATKTTSDIPAKKKKGYQRIEEWDAERQANGELSWEERVQFEGQRYGNQVRQNDILIRNLHTF